MSCPLQFLYYYMQTVFKESAFLFKFTQSLGQNSLKSSENIVKQIKNCPIKLLIDYDYGELKFTWDCVNVKHEQGTFFRQILIIDVESYNDFEEIFYIIQTFYKKLNLGHFMKVLLTNDELKIKWIQKTSDKLDKENFITRLKGNCNILKTCQNALKLAKKYEQPVSILLFTKQIHLWNQAIIQKLIEYKSKKQSCYTFHLFYETGDFYKFQRFSSKFLFFQYYSYRQLHDLDDKLRIFFHQQNKLRVIEAEIMLTCLNGDIYLRNSDKFSWYLQTQVLCKKMYGLYNNTKYQCVLLLNTYQLQKVGFQVQFTLKMLDLTKFQMKQYFYISIQNPATTIQQAKNLMIEQFKFNQYSEMPKSLKILASPVEKILVKQKKNKQDYLSYQKQFFLNQ